MVIVCEWWYNYGGKNLCIDTCQWQLFFQGNSFMNNHKKDMCLKEIGICAQNLLTILDLTINMIMRVCVAFL